MLLHSQNRWTAAKLAYTLVFALLCLAACHLLYQNGLVRDRFGISGTAFSEGLSLWLALLLSFAGSVCGGLSLFVRVQSPSLRRAAVGAMLLFGAAAAACCVTVFAQSAGWMRQVSGGLYPGP